MPALIIIVGLAGLILIIGGYAIQEITRPYPEERDAKRKSRMEAERLRRHAERDAIMAHAEIVDQRTKAEIKRQYMRDQYPPGVPIPDVPLPDLPPDPREHMDEIVQADPNLRHRIVRPETEEPEWTGPDTRDLRAALRARSIERDTDQTGPAGEFPAADRSANLRSALSRTADDPDDLADDPTGSGEPATRADIIRANIARRELAKKSNPFRQKRREPVPEEPDRTDDGPSEDTAPAKPKKSIFSRKASPMPKPEPDVADEAIEPDTDTEPKPGPAGRKGLFGRKHKTGKGIFGKKSGQEPEPDEDDAYGIPQEELDRVERELFGADTSEPEEPVSRGLPDDDDVPVLDDDETPDQTVNDTATTPGVPEPYAPDPGSDPYADFMSDTLAAPEPSVPAGHDLIPVNDEPEELPEDLEDDDLEDELEPVDESEDIQDDDGIDPEDGLEPVEDPEPRRGLFGRKPKAGKPKKPKRGLFGRNKKQEPGIEEEPNDAVGPEPGKQKRGLLGRKKHDAPAGPERAVPDENIPSRSVNDFLEDDDLPAEPEAEDQDGPDDDDIYGDPDEELEPADKEQPSRRKGFLPFGRR